MAKTRKRRGVPNHGKTLNMIISASYKTDIPAFYGEWFVNRLRAGYCKMLNPYNRKVIRVSLLRRDVDGIVFWTKNVRLFSGICP